jgi:hypothetical protein
MSTAATTLDTPPATYAAVHGTDFADWLSPILVKELRQGLKTRAFVVTFILVQVAMILLMALRLLADETDSSFGSFADGMMWTALGAALLVFMPLRGLTAVGGEVKANTLDLVALTRMGSFRIVAGKWMALVVQTVLLTIAVLPYAVLRYFFGQVEIVSDMNVLAAMLCGSAVLSSASVALSTLPQSARTAVVILIFPLMSSVMGLSSMLGVSIGLSSGSGALALWAIGLPSAAAYILFFLLEGASPITPAASKQSALRRLLALAVALIAAGLQTAGASELAMTVLGTMLPMLIWAAIAAITERRSDLPIIYMPWIKRGVLGRLGGLLLLPGPGTGILFAMLLHSLGMVTLLPSMKLESPLAFAIVSALMLLTPALLVAVLPKAKNRFPLYLLGHLLMILWWSFTAFAGEASRLMLQCLLPTSAFFALMDDNFGQRVVQKAMPMLALSGALLGLLLSWYWAVDLRALMDSMARARQMANKEPQTPDV